MRNIFIYIIKIYQKLISPMFPSSCRFYPSCSHYAVDSVSKYGVIKGGAKAAWRILRCNPFNKGGYDPA